MAFYTDTPYEFYLVEVMWNGFALYFFDRMNRIIRILSPPARDLSAEGPIILSILLILLILSN